MARLILSVLFLTILFTPEIDGFQPYKINHWELDSGKIDLSSEHHRLNELVDNSFRLRTEVFFERDFTGIALNTHLIPTISEVYWDNIKIGNNGGKNQPGKVNWILPVPDSLLKRGKHRIAVHVTNRTRLKKTRSSYIQIGPTHIIRKNYERRLYSTLFIIAIFLTSAMFNLVLYFGFNRKSAYLFFCVYCLSHAFKALYEPGWFYKNEDFVLYQTFSRYIYLSFTTGSVSLLAFLLYQFGIKHRVKFLLLSLLLSLFSFFYLSESVYIVSIIIIAFSIVLYALYRKMYGSVLSFIGLIGFCVFTNLGYNNVISYGYFAGILFFIFCMILSLGRQISLQTRLRQEAVLKSSRLENELLKRNIQPHFIMNTLTSLQELILINPRQASDLIDALAEEFRIFSKVSDRKLIPVPDELEMCRAHLRIMEYRKEIKLHLETSGLTGKEEIPPGIFHTLIENGITHGFSEKTTGIFSITKIMDKKYTVYILKNNGENNHHDNEHQKGTGLKYIRARLEESFPGLWSFESKPDTQGWINIIRIKKTGNNS